MNLGILTSGDLGEEILKKIISNFNVVVVLTDSNSQAIGLLCSKNNIPFFKGNPRQGKGYEFIKNIKIDVIISINYLFLVENDIIKHPKKLAFNIHGSLLPKYRGRTPHVWAIINNEKKTGITAHIIDEKCDSGDIISQIHVEIEKNNTGNDILNIFKLEYYNLVLDVLKKIMIGKLQLRKQDEFSSTFII